MSQPITISADLQQRIDELSRQLVIVRGYL